MTAQELRKKYLAFFVKKGHKEIPSASLVPENDPTVLFISAGMHPLVPYLLGEPHPLGQRLVDVQKCLRTDDIDEVGDTYHHTFFEMLGNWSIGDPKAVNGIGKDGYFKKEAITWSLEFLTKKLNLSQRRILVSVFAGDKDAPRDEESAQVWQSLGIPKKRVYYFPKKDNWWGPAGRTGPCGPDTEMFYDTGKPKCGPLCQPGCSCGKFFEIWNDVFMEYNRTKDGKYEPLKQKNVDTGMGVERTVAVLQGKDDNYQTELFLPIINQIEVCSGQSYRLPKNKKPQRIIADHLRAAVFVMADGVLPSNVERGYVLRRLIRRAIRYGRLIGVKKDFTTPIAKIIIEEYGFLYEKLKNPKSEIIAGLSQEEVKFGKTLEKGLKEFQKLAKDKKLISGREAFYLYETFGFPLEITHDLAKEKAVKVDIKGFNKALKVHQKKSRKGAAQKFAGGLSDESEKTVRLHTATHLLQASLRQVLGKHVYQAGSNITAKRLRFDFTHSQKLSKGQIKKIEDIVNQKTSQNLLVSFQIMSFSQGVKKGALIVPGKKYDEKVKVYSIEDPAKSGQVFSKEVCGGPHVDFTSELGNFKIIKEESAGSGTRRIYAVLI